LFRRRIGKKNAKACNEFKRTFEEASLRHQENGGVYGWEVSDDFLYVSCETPCSTQGNGIAG